MPAAVPGTETLSIARQDGTEVSVTLHYDPDTRAWADPAVTATGAGGAVLSLSAASGDVLLAVEAGVPIRASVLTAVGLADRDAPTSVALMAAVPTHLASSIRLVLHPGATP